MKKILTFVLALTMWSAAMANNLSVPPELKDKTITVVVPYPVGGQSDLWNRITASKVKELTGLNVVVLNKAGGDGLIGTADVAKAQPDGLTLLATDSGPIVMSPLMKDPNAVPREKFVTVLASYRTPQGIYVSAESRYRTIQDLIKDIRARPGKVTYGCGYSLCNLAMDKFTADIKGTINGINYKGAPQSITDLMGGHIDFIMAPPVALTHVRNGKLRVLAFSSAERLSDWPDAVAFRELIPGFAFENFAGVYAPAGTPKHIVDFFNRAYREAFKDPVAQEFITKGSSRLFDGTPEEAERFVQQNVNLWRPIVEKYYTPHVHPQK